MLCRVFPPPDLSRCLCGPVVCDCHTQYGRSAITATGMYRPPPAAAPNNLAPSTPADAVVGSATGVWLPDAEIERKIKEPGTTSLDTYPAYLDVLEAQDPGARYVPKLRPTTWLLSFLEEVYNARYTYVGVVGVGVAFLLCVAFLLLRLFCFWFHIASPTRIVSAPRASRFRCPCSLFLTLPLTHARPHTPPRQV